MRIIFAALLLCVINTTVLGYSTAQVRIVGGTEVPQSAYPWSVSLLKADIFNAFLAQTCGGSLIAPNVVLTAAHCVDDLSGPIELDVAVGINDLRDIAPEDRVRVIGIYTHPKYDDRKKDNDVALLILSENLDTPILPLLTPAVMNEVIAANANMTVVGWGALDNSYRPEYPAKLQEVQLPYVDTAVCNAALSDDLVDNPVTNNMFCAGLVEGGKDACLGDSGGPIVYTDASDNTYQIGIVSWGIECAVPEQYGVYVKIVNYLTWIEGMLNGPIVSSVFDAGFIGVSEMTTAVFPVSNSGNTPVSVQAITIDSGNFIANADHTCDLLQQNSTCEIQIDIFANVTGQLNGRIFVSFSNGDISTVNITGDILPVVDTNPQLETSNRRWFSGSDAAWVAATFNGEPVYRSGAIGDNQTSVLLTHITGPDTLVFDWRSSSESGYDFLALYIDGIFIKNISGENTWQKVSQYIGAGHHRVSWRYIKDGDISEGNDYGEIDNFSVSKPYVEAPKPDRDGGNSGGSSGGGGSLVFSLLLLGGRGLYRGLGRK